MKKIIFVFFMLLVSVSFWAGNYRSFKVSVYTRAYEVEKMKDLHWLDSTWTIISSQLKVDKIYLETHRDLLVVPDETLELAKKFFRDRGIEVGGGITYTIDESNNFQTFCYTNPSDRKKVQEIAEHTARHFDDFILDDFFFTNCKCDLCIKAKGAMSWTDYRLKIMTEAGQNLVLDPARKVNSKVKVIIKYPNWYDHFQGLGFDLEHGPNLFDGIWTGTETRDPSSAQHLQNYLGYNIIRYFENLRPGHNGGGWVDSGGSNMGMDRYAEQLWLTMFAKAREINLFAYNQLLDVKLRPSHRTLWQGQGTSFDYDEMMKLIKDENGNIVQPTTIARAAGVTLEAIDKFVWQLGNPVGIKSYKPFHSVGEDFLPNYLGMIGLPMDMRQEFPTDQQVVLLTEQASYDKNIVQKIEAQLKRGGDVVITTGLLKAIPEMIDDIAEIRCTDLKALVNDFGFNGKCSQDILIPEVFYLTNDAWEIVSAGNPLQNGVVGYPIVLRAQYSKGNLYVLTIPDSFGDLYELPEQTLNIIRQILSKDLDIRIEAPSKVSLFAYDNGTFIVESFLDTPVTIQVITSDKVSSLRSLVDGVELSPVKREIRDVTARRRTMNTNHSYSVTLMPHSFKVFKKI